jgi:hypothetical protein
MPTWRGLWAIKTEQAKGLLHMRRQGCGEFQHTTFRMRQAQGARMEMQRIAEAFQMRRLPALFAIPHDRAA